MKANDRKRVSKVLAKRLHLSHSPRIHPIAFVSLALVTSPSILFCHSFTSGSHPTLLTCIHPWGLARVSAFWHRTRYPDNHSYLSVPLLTFVWYDFKSSECGVLLGISHLIGLQSTEIFCLSSPCIPRTPWNENTVDP